MAIGVVLPLANAQERAPIADRRIITTWHLHSLLPERRVAVEVVATEAGLGVVEAEVVQAEVRNKASPYEFMCRLCEALYILFRDRAS